MNGADGTDAGGAPVQVVYLQSADALVMAVTPRPVRSALNARAPEPSGSGRSTCVTLLLRKRMDAIARALADPIRREILRALRGCEATTGALAERFPVSRPAVSRHLRVLREVGLI